MQTNARVGHTLISYLSSPRNVLGLIRIQFRTPLWTVTSRSKHFVSLRAMGPLPRSGVMPGVTPLVYPKVNRDETWIDSIHDHKVPDPYRQ